MEKEKSLSEYQVKIQTNKPRGKVVLLVLALLLSVIITGTSFLYRNQLLTMLSFTKVGAEPLYTMTYYGDYGFDEYLKTAKHPMKSFARGLQDQQDASWACSVFSAWNEKGNPVLGRNFDWHHRSAVLLFTNPPNGYRSVSVIDPYYCGYNFPDYIPASIFDRAKLLMAPWIPMDGMNEWGLAIGIMALPNAEDSDDNLQKMNINPVDVIRLTLDYAKNVEEAITLIKKHNVSIHQYHYLLADSSGNSAVIEFVDGRLEVIQTKEPWQVSTNFQIYGVKDGALLCNRYAAATQTLQKNNGIISDDNAMKLLNEISQANTMWSVVYNLSTGDIQVRTGFDPTRISQVKKFKLKMKM